MTAATLGSVHVCKIDHVLMLQVRGPGKAAQCTTLRQIVEEGLEQGATSVRVDLRHCDYMDSTFIGTLLIVRRMMQRRPGGDFALVAPSPECQDILARMGVLGILPTVVEEEGPQDWSELRCDGTDVNVFRRHVVHAHQELATLEGPTGETFKAVARGMMESMEQAEKERG